MSEYITEIANDIAKSCPDLVENGCGNDNCVACLAFKLIGLGYQKQEWISVDERLPETDNKNTYDYNVLVYVPEREGCRQHGMFLGKLKHSEAQDGSCNFWNIPIEESKWTVWGWSYFEHPVVTHWMPLPEAPKMKGGAE